MQLLEERDLLCLIYFFADDCIIFGDASFEGAGVVREVVREYEKVSG